MVPGSADDKVWGGGWRAKKRGEKKGVKEIHLVQQNWARIREERVERCRAKFTPEMAQHSKRLRMPRGAEGHKGMGM